MHEKELARRRSDGGIVRPHALAVLRVPSEQSAILCLQNLALLYNRSGARGAARVGSGSAGGLTMLRDVGLTIIRWLVVATIAVIAYLLEG